MPFDVLCRQEVMALVNKSGKFTQKFEGFTGRPLKVCLAFGTDIVDGYIFTVGLVMLRSVTVK